MVHTVQGQSKRHYGSGFTGQRHYDRGDPSSDTRKSESIGAALWSELKTVAKSKRREHVRDQKTGPKEPHSTVPSIDQEAVIVAFCGHMLLPLDDCLYALQAMIPALRRSSLHRCVERHGISRLPEVEVNKPTKEKFRSYPIGFFHVDIAELRSAEGKLYLFVVIDRTSRFAFVQLLSCADMAAASGFLEALIEAVPYRIHIVLTDNGIQFADLPKTVQGRPPGSAVILSTVSALATASSTGLPSPTILGQTAKSSA